VNPSTQTGLTSTSSDRRPAPSSNFVRGKSGYAPFWPGGLDSLTARPNDMASNGGVTGTRRLGTIPPGLTRGIRLSSEKNRDPTSSDLSDIDGDEDEAASPVVTPFFLGDSLLTHGLNNSPKHRPTHPENSICRKPYQANPLILITYCQSRYLSLLIHRTKQLN
jgi:hypothetical protein